MFVTYREMSGLLIIRGVLTAAIVATVFLQACSPGPLSRVAASRYRPTMFPAGTHRLGGPPAIVPLPRKMRLLPGEMAPGSLIVIDTNGNSAHAVALQLASEFARLGVTALIDDPGAAPATIQLRENAGIQELGTEGYKLDVDATGIRIVANTSAGLFYGAETLEQLASYDGRTARSIPFVQITDWPEYRWRGLHLDVSRHFFPADVVEQYIDIAARFKLNRFHWHLTDDQGWRLEIPEYPKLVSVGGCRSATQIGAFDENKTDGIHTCAYYTDEEVREVVAFAEARHVQIVPEIEGPGHSVEALAAYPSLACDPGPYATLDHWGSTKYSLCPTEQTFQFYDDVYFRLAQLFPAPVIHIGGDEVPYYSWRGDSTVARLMRREGLPDYAAVQGYFERRLAAIAQRYQRRVAGWDEIDRAGISRTAIIMAWTGGEAALAASHHGNDVVMTPNPPLYFDAYQGPPSNEPTAFEGRLTTLKMVYDYDPAESLGATVERTHILGAQGNLWTEYIPTPAQLWYMAYPRALALSELCWTPKKNKDWSGFRKRAGIALQRLEPDVTFRIPETTFRLRAPDMTPVSTALNVYHVSLPRRASTAQLVLEEVVPNAEVHYTLDGSIPTALSRRYLRPLALELNGGVAHVAAVASLHGYRVSAPSFLTVGTP